MDSRRRSARYRPRDTCTRDGASGPASRSPTIPQATAAQLAAANLDELPLAASADRIDLAAPTFSNPTRITNPLFPISNLRSAVLAGEVDGKPFKTETTLLHETRIIEWNGQQVETLVSQYVAYLDGRLEEVALDHYAQADDGSVWYFGEDVFNYRDGVIADTEGTWFAGREGPAAMIMPAHPRVGDVYRSENVPGLVFEEVTIKAVGRTVDGPRGPVEGAIVGDELHDDGTHEDKTFAPGYGEFFTGGGGDVEAMALAVPADALAGPPSPELDALAAAADEIFRQAQAKNWKAAAATLGTMTEAWNALRAGELPPRLEPLMKRALDELGRGIAARDSVKAGLAAVAVGQARLDFELRHRPPADIDRGRFELWARELVIDASAGDSAAARGDLATLEWIRDRFAHTLGKVELTGIDTQLVELRTKVTDGDLEGVASETEALRSTVAGLQP